MRIHPVVLLVALLLQACGLPPSREEFDKTPEAQYLMATVERLVARDHAAIESQMDERVHQPDVRSALLRLANLVPPGAPQRLEPVAWAVHQHAAPGAGGPSRTAHVAIEYAFADSRWIVASATLSGEPGAFRMLAFNVEPISAPVAELNAFTLQGKGLAHAAHLLLALCAFGVSAYAFVRCVRTRGLKRKWLWAAFTLVGVGSFTLNWSSGAFSAEVLRFGLPSAGFARAGWVGPWTITFGVPVGALAFLWTARRRAAMRPLDR